MDAQKFGIVGDVDKLIRITSVEKYVLALATKNPECDAEGDWIQGVNKFNQKFTPLRIKSLTSPTDFPQSYFLGLLEVVSQ